MKLLLAVIGFLFGFAGIFYVVGTFITKPLPPMKEIPEKIATPEFWTSNWQGALGGLLVGVVLAFLLLKRKPKRAEK